MASFVGWTFDAALQPSEPLLIGCGGDGGVFFFFFFCVIHWKDDFHIIIVKVCERDWLFSVAFQTYFQRAGLWGSLCKAIKIHPGPVQLRPPLSVKGWTTIWGSYKLLVQQEVELTPLPSVDSPYPSSISSKLNSIRVHMSDRDKRGHTEATGCSWTAIHNWPGWEQNPEMLLFKGASLNISQSLVHFKFASCCVAAFKSSASWPWAEMHRKYRFCRLDSWSRLHTYFHNKRTIIHLWYGQIAPCKCILLFHVQKNITEE